MNQRLVPLMKPKADKGVPPERIDPLQESIGTVSHHLVKYLFAGQQLGFGRCLDVGCGLGYGSHTLATASRQVVGIDLDPSTIATASARYGEVRFCVMDAHRLGFREESFESVVSFEAVEHLADPNAHLAEVERVLTDDGAYIVSTPLAGTGGAPELNPFHHHEYTEESFRELLTGRFRRVQILGQRRVRSSAQRTAVRLDVVGLRKIHFLRPLARRVSNKLGTRSVEEALPTDFVIDAVSADTTELIAVCHKSD